MFGNRMNHCLVFASLISPSKMILFEKKYQTFDTVFHHQMKHCISCLIYYINNWDNSHAVPYFVSSSFLSLDLLYFKSVAIVMHDISNSLTPTNVSNLFAYQSNIHSYNTRSSSRGDYYVKHSRLDKQT